MNQRESEESIKRSKLLKKGKRQVIRVPKEFEIDGKEVLIRKVEGGLLVTPVADSWDFMEAALSTFDPSFSIERRAAGCAFLREQRQVLNVLKR